MPWKDGTLDIYDIQKAKWLCQLTACMLVHCCCCVFWGHCCWDTAVRGTVLGRVPLPPTALLGIRDPDIRDPPPEVPVPSRDTDGCCPGCCCCWLPGCCCCCWRFWKGWPIPICRKESSRISTSSHNFERFLSDLYFNDFFLALEIQMLKSYFFFKQFLNACIGCTRLNTNFEL